MRKVARALLFARLRLARRLRGIEVVNESVGRPGNHAWILRRFGARIGKAPSFYGQIIVHNANGGYRNLTVGDHVHLGRGVLLDLTESLTIEDQTVVSMGCTLLTHADIGERPLSRVYPRESAPLTIGRGAYLGANATILCGCDVGPLSVVAAGAVVTKAVPPGVLVAGVPARVIRTLPSTE